LRKANSSLPGPDHDLDPTVRDQWGLRRAATYDWRRRNETALVEFQMKKWKGSDVPCRHTVWRAAVPGWPGAHHEGRHADGE